MQTKCNDPAWNIFSDLIQIGDICIDHQYTVFRKQFGIFMERMTDIIEILKKIKMICINI